MSNYLELSRENLVEKILKLVGSWESTEKSDFVREKLLSLLTWEQLRDIYMSLLTWEQTKDRHKYTQS